MAQSTHENPAEWQRILHTLSPESRCDKWREELAKEFVPILEQLLAVVPVMIPDIRVICTELLVACQRRAAVPFFSGEPVGWIDLASSLQTKWGDVDDEMPYYLVYKITVDMVTAMLELGKTNEEGGKVLGEQAKANWAVLLHEKGIDPEALSNNTDDAICRALLAARDRIGLTLCPGVDLRKIARSMLSEWNLRPEHLKDISDCVWDAFLHMIDSEARAANVSAILERDAAGSWFLQLNPDITGFADRGLNEMRMARHHAGKAIAEAAATRIPA